MNINMSNDQHLLSTATNIIDRLKIASDKFTKTEKHIQFNNHDIKSQINHCISRQMDGLRSRESWLMNQIDLVSSAKEDIFRQQKDLVNELCSKMTLIVQNYDSSFAHLLKDFINEFSNMDLDFDGDESCISFEADIKYLQHAIYNFGKIVEKPSLINKKACKDGYYCREFQSPSLPKTFEDYEDVDEHILYKPLSEHCDLNVDTINVRLPSIPESEWLSKKSKQSDRPVGKPVSIGSWLSKESTTGDVSNWLKNLKVSPENEEDEFSDFEVVKTENNNSVNIVSEACQKVLDHMDSILFSSTENWLSKRQINTFEEELFMKTFFSHASENKNDWLSQPSKNLLSGCKKHCLEKKRSYDIENLDQMACFQIDFIDLDKDIDDVCSCSENLSDWLSTESSSKMKGQLLNWLSSDSKLLEKIETNLFENLREFHKDCEWIKSDSCLQNNKISENDFLMDTNETNKNFNMINIWLTNDSEKF